MIDKDELRSLIDDGLVDRIISVEETTSTNDMAKDLVREGFNGTALFAAELQTAGRGRLGRDWSSPKGTGIYITYLMAGIDTSEAASLNTLIAGLAVAEGLSEYSSDIGAELECRIKWPNDIVTNGRKICGILTELITEGSSVSMMIGIGINIGQKSFPEELSAKGTSYFIETGRLPSREDIINRIIRKYTGIRKHISASGTSDFVKRYSERMVNLDKEVILSSANGDFMDNPYIARGITEQGDLIVEDGTGRRKAVTSGEISVRGVLGYV